MNDPITSFSSNYGNNPDEVIVDSVMRNDFNQ